ncbi:DUF1285 domain-containing protein [Moraxella sp.]|uniref:DUF1285 domain-containing protein n=1 Tax=Moraxella sp. TaxID=479 RepID=UPI0026DBB528|nr:DUF1285 domain-containing protein [Moraxella sp.]MDO4894594.1 DUF1285 domain-containing protein [Moraxella sp.]
MNDNNQLVDILGRIQADDAKLSRKILPLACWQPTQISPFDIHIKDNGEWWHDGTKMTRQSLIDLFASVLWVQTDEQGGRQYFLRTPTDQYAIKVDDAPLFVNTVQLMQDDDGVAWIYFGTTNGDLVRLDEAHQPYFGQYRGEDRLYVKVRFDLPAKISSTVLFHLVEMGQMSQEQDKVMLKLTSGGKIYTLTAQS